MNISILSGNPLRALRALAFLAVSTSLAAACGGGAEQAMPFSPSIVPSSALSLEADGTAAALSGDTFGLLGEKGKGHGKGNQDDDGADEGDEADDVDDVDDVDDTESDEADDHSGRNPHDGPGPFEGTVSSFRGLCPAVTFNLKGMRIVATSATTYIGGTCETLRPNVKVVVTGTHGTERRVFNATAITITRTPTTS